MYAGRIVEQAATKELLANVRMPYTEALFESIPRLADPSNTKLRVIGGRPPNLAELPAGCAFADRCRYVQDRCRREVPQLSPMEDDPTHVVACWYPVEAAMTRRVVTP